MLGLDELSLVGESMGGCLAAWFAIEQPSRIRRLVLLSPFGLRVPEHPSTDFFSIPDEEVPEYLVADMSLFAGAPMPPPPEFLADRYRESTSFARVAVEEPVRQEAAEVAASHRGAHVARLGRRGPAASRRSGGGLGGADPERRGEDLPRRRASPRRGVA